MTKLQPRFIERLGARGRAITDIAVTSDGETFAVCFDHEATLAVASWAAGTQICQITAPSTVEAIAFAPDGGRIAAACVDGRVYEFEIPGANQVAQLEGGNGGYYDVAWSPDGSLIVAGHYEPIVSAFDALGIRPATTLDAGIFSDEGRTAVAFSPDGATFASTAGNTLLRWSVPQMKCRKLELKEYAFIVDAQFSRSGMLVAGLAEIEGRCSLHVWHSATGRKRGHIALPQFSQRMAWSADDSFIAVIERDAPGVSLWDPALLERSQTSLEGVAMAMSAIAAHPERVAVIGGSEAGDLVIWERLNIAPNPKRKRS
ncbi:MAG TPA: WD40 repeat domain-containing protein [Steroidobacteraceae bacterium]|jgi:WD40 repeat protein|nr:WD40 repeat domain-containing protein [Steroidobacteraceae bacterium]